MPILQVLGTTSMAATTGKHPGQLKDDVASPGGTTIDGIHELEKGGLRGIFMNVVVAAAKRIIHEVIIFFSIEMLICWNEQWWRVKQLEIL